MLAAGVAPAQNPDTLWVRIDEDEAGKGLAIHQDQLYVANSHGDGSTLYYYMIVKRLTLDGDIVWYESLQTRTPGMLHDLRIECTADDRVIAGAATREGPTLTRFYIFARDSVGNLLWDHDFVTGPYAFELDICTDTLGNAFLVALTFSDSTRTDWHIVKVGPDGFVAWERVFDGPAHGVDLVQACAPDGSGGVYAVGMCVDTTGQELPTIVKYDSAGVQEWTRMLRPDGCGLGIFRDLVVGADGDALAVGADYTSPEAPGPVARFTPSGDTVWCRWLQGRAEHAVLDREGYLCVAGRVSNGQDIGTWRLGPDGEQLWAQTYDGPAGLVDYVNDITTDKYGNVLVCGFSVDSYEPEIEIAVIVAYSVDGMPLWIERYLRLGNTLAWPRGIAADADGCVYVTGVSFQRRHSHGSCFTIKYSATPSWVRAVPKAGVRPMAQTICRGMLRLTGWQEADLLDIAGRRVMSLQPAENDIRHLSPGVYFIAPSPQSSPTRGEEATIRKIVIQH